MKIERGEITAGTVNNWLKAVRLFLEMNDVILNWKKIRRMLPTIRRFALDRVPTLEELREILDAADIRGKALTLVLVLSGIREGAVPSLLVSNYSKIRVGLSDIGSSINNDDNGSVNRGSQQLLAGKLLRKLVGQNRIDVDTYKMLLEEANRYQGNNGMDLLDQQN